MTTTVTTYRYNSDRIRGDSITAVNPMNLPLFSGLHCASSFGIVEIVTSLVEVEGCDINQTDWSGSTPLIRAAEKGQEGVVEILLGLGDVHPEKPDMFGETQLL